MALLDDVKQILNQLASGGWDELFADHGLKIGAADLKSELSKQLAVDRTAAGFEDFAGEGARGIEPGQPARSLLYHALASPNVLKTKSGRPLTKFPTLGQLETVENYVFGMRPPSIQELASLAAGDLMGVVLFALEYRPAVDTVHRKHADMCFSRTGVARVGTTGPVYLPERRGFTSNVEDKPHEFRVLPARYAAFIATQRSGSEKSFGPMRFNFREKHPEYYDPSGILDSARKFWVPIHKLFDGAECLQGHAIQLRLVAHQVNEKLRRIHLEFASRKFNGGWSSPAIDQPPFRFSDGIASFSNDPDDGHGLLVPTPHRVVVKAAELNGKAVTYRVPKPSDIKSRSAFAPSLEITAKGAIRHAPEYVHARTAPQLADPDLGNLPNPAGKVISGHYEAQHYVDFTGDGWIDVDCPQLNPLFPRFVPAYSLVTAPDFFPNCDQRELMDWWLQRAPKRLRDFLWETRPLTLMDERTAPNLKLNVPVGGPDAPVANFRPEDDTVTAIVSMPFLGDRQDRPLVPPAFGAHSWLPDAAAGIFAPGWDTSFDVEKKINHLASYGLGSPFPEDSKLCAALSTFWPAVAPDAARTYADPRPTVAPLTDEEIGSVGNLPWDGITGPRDVPIAGGKTVIEYPEFDHVDYVQSALLSRFSLSLTAKVDTAEYIRRVLAMARAYLAVGVPIDSPEDKTNWWVISFRKLSKNDPERKQAEQQAPGVMLGDDVYGVVLAKLAPSPTPAKDFKKVWMVAKDKRVVVVGGTPQVLVRPDPGVFATVVVDA